MEAQAMQSLEGPNAPVDFADQQQAQVGSSGQLTLLDAIDRILDKGMVINGDISISIAGSELLTLKINLVIASLETAKRYGVELPWEKWSGNGNEAANSNGFQIPEDMGGGNFGQIPFSTHNADGGTKVNARNPPPVKGRRKKGGKSAQSKTRK
jgi:hypothetical protein